MKKRIRVYAFSLLLCLLGVSLWASEVERFELEREKLFEGNTEIGSFNRSKLKITFETVRPTLPSRIILGVQYPGKAGTRNFFRKKIREKIKGTERSTEHSFKFNVRKFETIPYGGHLLKQNGGVMVFRIETLDEKSGKLSLKQGKFAYRREKSGKYWKYRRVNVIEEGPFIQNVTPTSVNIMWKTDFPSRGWIKVGKIGDKKRIINVSKLSFNKNILIDNLEPDTSYQYKVNPGADGFISAIASFKTAPANGCRRTIKFAFMSDSRNGTQSGPSDFMGTNATKLLSAFVDAYKNNSEFILFNGDLVNGYTSCVSQLESQLKNWKFITQPIGSLIPIYVGMGNHEIAANFFKFPDPEKPGKNYLAFSDKRGVDSTESIFSRAFSMPNGSVYGLGSPAPEVRNDVMCSLINKGPSYGRTVYSFNWGNIHIVFINSNYWTSGTFRGGKAWWSSRPMCDRKGTAWALSNLGGNREGYLMSNLLLWLDRDLAAAENDPNIDVCFVTMHEPAFPNGGHPHDALYWGERYSEKDTGLNDTSQPLGDVTSMRDRFINILMNHPKVVALMTGDEHNYSRTAIDSNMSKKYPRRVWQIISGGAGAPYYMRNKHVPWKNSVKAFSVMPHYCQFEVTGKKVKLKVISDRGEILDTCENLAK